MMILNEDEQEDGQVDDHDHDEMTMVLPSLAVNGMAQFDIISVAIPSWLSLSFCLSPSIQAFYAL